MRQPAEGLSEVASFEVVLVNYDLANYDWKLLEVMERRKLSPPRV